ncbi:MAG: TetR/AcrR family transcriptional regulator [Synergistaceae bacterium]|nr:TetR/AcrR family transcriptional regulator [Synergistaceae bacterium]
MTYRKQQAMKTRQRILDSATKLFRADLYEKVTIQDIVREAGVSNGAFYAHFKSKEEVLNYANIESENKYLVYYKKKLKISNLAALEKLKAFSRQVLLIMAENGPINFCLRMSYALRNPVTQISSYRPYFKILEQLISDCRKAGVLKQDTNDNTIRDFIFYLHRGISIEWAIRGNLYPIDSKYFLIEEYIDSVTEQ